MSADSQNVIADLIRPVLERRRGLSAELARVAEVSPTTVTKWKKGEIVPEPWRWPTIERVLDLDEGALARAAGHDQVADAYRAQIAQLMQRIEDLEARVARSETPDR